MSLIDTTEKLRRDRTLIEQLIEDPSRLGPDFQRIVHLSDRSVLGHKATGRGQAGTELDSTLALLSSAQSTGLVERLDWAFRCLAFDLAAEHPNVGEVHLTPEPETYGGACPPRLATAFGRGRRALSVVAEVHDYGLLHPRLQMAADDWRGWGWQVVLADVSQLDDPAVFRAIGDLRPDVIQVDVSRPASARRDEMLRWAGANGAQVHAVRVDDEASRTKALELGAIAGRGQLFGAPGPL